MQIYRLHLQLRTITRKLIKICHIIQRTGNFFIVNSQKFGVKLRCFRRTMPRHKLYVPHIDLVLYAVCSKRMPKRVCTVGLCCLHQLFKNTQGFADNVSQRGGTSQSLLPRAACREIELSFCSVFTSGEEALHAACGLPGESGQQSCV